MKKPAKIVVATTLGATLLLGGSTYAIWNSQTSANTEAEILTGDSDVKPLDQGLWTDLATSRKAPEAPPVIITDINSFRAVPSDEIGYAQLFNVKFSGPPTSTNLLQLKFNSDAGLNPAALKARGIIAQATVKDLDTGVSASSDLSTNTLTTGYTFVGSLPAAGSRVEVSLNFKINAEVSAEDTKKLKSLVSASVLSVSAVGQVLAPPVLSGATLPAGVQGEVYKNTTLAATGEQIKFSITEGALPEGVTLNETTGVLSGTPKTAGVYNFTVKAKNSGGESSKAFTIDVKADPPTIATASLATAFMGTSYSQSLSGTGANPTYTVTEGSLPTGLNFNASTGLISGTPTVHGSSSFTITKTTVKGSVSKAFSLDVRYAAPTLAATTPPVIRTGEAYSYALTGTGEASTYAITSGSLPTGIAFDAATGTFSGTTTVGGDFVVTVSKTNESGSASRTLTFQSKAAAPKIATNDRLPEGNKAVAYNFKIAATGDDITYSATGLPDGLSIDPRTGVISGTPTGTGAVFVYVTATNNGGSDRVQLLLAIRATPPKFVTETLPEGEVALDYSAKIETVEASSIRLYGSIPPGLSFNSTTGVLSGKPTKSGTYDFYAEASSGSVVTRQDYSVYIETDGPVISTKTLPNSTQNVSYSELLTGKGENSTYAITAGALPPGFSLSTTTGRITSSGNGNSTAYGVYNFTVTKTNEKGTAVKELSINVLYQAPTLTGSSNLGSSRIGVAYSSSFTGTGNGATYSLSKGALPDGITLDTVGGKLSGAGTKTGDYAFTITKTNTTGSVSKDFTMQIVEVPPTVTTSVFAPSTINTYYEFQVVAKGENLTYSTEFGPMPAGLTLNEKTGVISGTPTVAGTTFIRIVATNSGGSANVTDYIRVNHVAPVITTTELPNAMVDQQYSSKVEVTGEEVTFSANNMPNGLYLNSATGEITGKPYYAETGTTTIYARNSGGTVTKAFKLDVITQPPTITNESLSGAIFNSSYSESITGVGSSNTYTVSNGTLPSGLSISNSNGAFIGKPTEHGVFNFTLTKSNVSGSVSKNFSIDVRYAKPTLGSATYPNGTLNSAYSVSPGGTGDFVTYSISQGQLPAGLSLNATTGVISGTPTAIGSNTFTLMKSNVDGMASKEITVVVNYAAPTFGSTSSYNLNEDSTYRFDLGGTGEGVTYAIYAGALPAGLSFDTATGVISGKTTAAVGTSHSFSVRKTNNGGSVVKAFAINVTYTAPTMVTTEYPKVIVGTPYSFAVQATGKAVTYALQGGGGSLPSGLTLNTSTGVISGTPTSVGSYTFTLTATNNGGTASLRVPLVVANTPPTMTVGALPDAVKGNSYNAFVTAGTGSGVNYAVVKGALPDGITLSATSGQLLGRATATAVTSTFTVQKFNNGGFAEQQLTIIVK